MYQCEYIHTSSPPFLVHPLAASSWASPSSAELPASDSRHASDHAFILSDTCFTYTSADSKAPHHISLRLRLTRFAALRSLSSPSQTANRTDEYGAPTSPSARLGPASPAASSHDLAHTPAPRMRLRPTPNLVSTRHDELGAAHPTRPKISPCPNDAQRQTSNATSQHARARKLPPTRAAAPFSPGGSRYKIRRTSSSD
ncbi:hypothetical protein DFH06DRAFT_1187775 [Mycena polygramma]|nr:hypothetical protein DFH06DRAFT_1187775 [Mycena polygramma]